MIGYDLGRWKPLFFTVWSGQALSLFGSRLVGFAVIWWLTEETGSASTLALAGFMEILPRIVLAPLAGPLVDRWNRRYIMMAADGFVAFATASLALLFWYGVAQPWHIFLLLLVRSSGDAVHNAAMLASTTLMAPKEHLSRVAGLNQTLQGAAIIGAPTLGALLVSVFPLQSILAIDVVTATIAVLTLVIIGIPQPGHREMPDRSSSFRTELREGFGYVAGNRGLSFLFFYAGIIRIVASPAWRFLPLLVLHHLDGEAIHFGTMFTATGIGIVSGGLILSVWGGFQKRVVTTALGQLGSGIAFFVLGITPAGMFALAIAACGLFGLTFSMSTASQQALIQTTVPAELQGRVFSLFTAATGAAQPLGLLIFGLLGDTLGVDVIFVLGGLSILAVTVSMFLTPSVMHMEDMRTPLATA